MPVMPITPQPNQFICLKGFLFVFLSLPLVRRVFLPARKSFVLCLTVEEMQIQPVVLTFIGIYGYFRAVLQ